MWLRVEIHNLLKFIWALTVLGDQDKPMGS